ncbi:LPS assembly lipoprotein LptE [Candidatus Marinimicrobia bacterium]|jgi:hypothetical protein|nr:LPS assembly lipoprotein LptE [Candidatus Neomarinimicrobiota bacterium]GIR18750.1 MAG: hypothetical protein CM15mP33_02720 [Candidatus Neomarinimicrobiota bacterium]|tara:strand:- start:926 stop:1501 length:576 start_codon:yes stop_codon:yes gene_type:complete
MIMALKRKLKKIVNSLSIFMLVGCSYYSMAGSIPANINNVYIPLIENDTAEFEISENLTSKITQEIAIQNILKITDDSNSDSTILGVITSATDGPFTFDSNEQVDEYRFSISLKILWVDNENEKNLIEKTFTGFGNYSINNDPSSDGIDNDNDGILDENDDDEFGDSRELAINIAINKIASDVVNSILSTW